MSYSNIAVDVRYRVPREGTAGGAITPGMLIQPSGSNWVVHSTAGGGSDFIADYLMEESIADAYSSGDFLPYLVLKEGDLVNALLTTSQTVAIGDKLCSNGDGYLKECSSGAESVGGDTNYITFTPLKDQLVDVAFVDPSATTQSLAVTIEGNYIEVSLATDGSGAITSTPELIESAIEAVDGYDNLVSMSTTGTGAVEAGTASMIADEVHFIAEEAVTTTSAVSRILVRKGAV